MENKKSKLIIPWPKKEKTKEEYVLKSDTKRKILRIAIWIILIFFFTRGIIVSLRPDQTQEVEDKITEFKKEFSDYKDQDTEILGFAQNFSKEYLTYEIGNEIGYLDRLKKYVSDNFLRSGSIFDFKKSAKVLYAQAYRKESYSESQWDVYVLAEVQYNLPKMSEDGSTFEIEVQTEEIQLKVPIYEKDSTYIVEDIPLYVNDDIKIKEYIETVYKKNELISDSIKENIEKSLIGFFKAYYEGEQNAINYYLTKDAVSTEFLGLNGRMKFKNIDGFSCYQEEGDEYIICIAKIKIEDSVNAAIIRQQFNLTLRKDGDKYYIKNMNTRTINLK